MTLEILRKNQERIPTQPLTMFSVFGLTRMNSTTDQYRSAGSSLKKLRSSMRAKHKSKE